MTTEKNSDHFNKSFNENLLCFLNSSPTPFHAVCTMQNRLNENGFIQLDEREEWDVKTQSSYYVVRNGSSIIAFTTGLGDYVNQGFRMLGAHTDSPCLKIKPKPDNYNYNYMQLGVEVYGGALLNPWFDRDLSLAGCVSLIDEDGAFKTVLVDLEKAIAIIPSLAIHLDRDANNNRKINAQEHLSPIIMLTNNSKNKDFKTLILQYLQKERPYLQLESILDFECFLYDVQDASLLGCHDEFVASARLDNLLSCFVGLETIISVNHNVNHNDIPCLLVCNDHEEVGSVSASGAQGTFLNDVLKRVIGEDNGACIRAIQRSMLISTDNAHAVHPNYCHMHDPNHSPLMNRGPVIKINANQSYATSSRTGAVFRHLCKLEGVSVQSFVTRSDVRCGSTIGPLTAAEIGVPTLDVGIPTLAMHSIRELAGTNDAPALCSVLKRFFCESDLEKLG